MSEIAPRRLLSLDGGGVKGLTTLYILQQIMHTVKIEKQLEDDPRPCDYFDLIGGTSTGGLIAIMLGRLGMDIEECIEKYRGLAKRVFGKKKTGGIVRKFLNATKGSEWFDSAILEQIIKEIIQERCGNEREPLLCSTELGCKIFVCATPPTSEQYQLLRSYPNPFVDTQCELWEAARATSAAPLFFKPITFQKSGDVFYDGAVLLKNPVRELVNEADQIWPGAPISCLISIGTGCVKAEELNPKLHKMMRAVISMSMNAENAAEAFVKEQRGKSLWERKQYYRFNVEQGIQEIELDDCEDEALNRMKQRTRSYLVRTSIATQIETCVKKLVNPNSDFDLMNSAPLPGITKQEILDVLSPVDFTENLGQMESDRCPETGNWIISHPVLQSLIAGSPGSPSTTWIYGEPGCGKTFLIFTILENLRMTNRGDGGSNSALLYFFCDKKTGDPARQETTSILRTLLAQFLLHLLEKDPKLVQGILDLCKEHAKDREDIPLWLLVQTFKRLFGSDSYLTAYIVLDGLDECSDWRTLLESLDPREIPNAKLILSSRDMDVIRELVVADSDDESVKAIKVTPDQTYKDIETFTRRKIRYSNVKDLGGKEKAIGLLIKESKGLFLLAKFRFDLLNKRGPRLGSDLEKTINQLPSELNDYYALELNRIKEDKHRDLARRLFLWILYARRALSSSEIIEALSVEQGDTKPRPTKAITRTWIDEVSGGLVVFEEITDTVVVAHETIRAFVLDFCWDDSIPSPTLGDIRAAHTKMLFTLITYLSFDDFEHPKKESQASQLEPFALLEYATRYWPVHLRQIAPSPELQGLFDALDAFLQSDQCVSWWGRTKHSSSHSLSILIGELQSYFQEWTHPQIESGSPITFDNILLELSKKGTSRLEQELGTEHPDTLTSMNNLASIFWNQGRLTEAEVLQVQVLETMKSVLGIEHPDTLTSMSNLASIFWNQGRLTEAEVLEVQVLETRKRVLGIEHPDTLTSMSNLASTFSNQGRFTEAEVLQVQVLETMKRVLGIENPDTLTSMNNLASIFSNQGRFTEAEVLQVQVLETRKRVLGIEHPDTLTSMGNLASTFWDQGRFTEAEVLEVQILETRKRVLGIEHPDTLTSMGNLASTFWDQGRLTEAEVLEVQILEMRKRVLGIEHPDTLTSMGNLASTFWNQGRFTEAKVLQVQVLETMKRVLGIEHPSTLTSMGNLAFIYHSEHRNDDATILIKHVLAVYTRLLGADNPKTLRLAGVLRSWETQ